MGQTRVDLRHLLEDLRDAYVGELEETILTEIVANALDSGSARVSLLTDATARTLVVVDDGSGMARRELARFHDLAASTKTRGEGIGFAGVGIKLGLLAAEEVLTETRRGETHVATRWHLAAKHRAPWKWVAPPGWVAVRGTAVGLKLRNPLSPLLDPGYLEATLRRHYEPLFDQLFDPILSDHYPAGVKFVVDGRALERRDQRAGQRAELLVRLPRKRKPAGIGYLERAAGQLPEERQGLAVSTLGKVIRRGWDWIGLGPESPHHVGGAIEVPALAAALTLNKSDFLRAGRRGITYLAYRKAIQQAIAAPLAAWGEARDREGTARRRAAQPLERDLETVLVDLADDFPALAALVERRSGGQRRLPSGAGDSPRGDVAAARVEAPRETGQDAVDTAAKASEPASLTESRAAEAVASGSIPRAGGAGPRHPARYGLAIDFEERPESSELGRLVESTVLVNAAHPAYRRAVASRADGYHVALTVGMALAVLAVEPPKAQEFLAAFLARWGEALSRDRRRRQDRPRH